MFRIERGSHVLVVAVMLLAVLAAPAPGQQTPPSLADTVRAVIERDGVEVARRRFAEIYPAHAAEYRIDVKEMAELGSGYMRAGDMARGQAVMEMVSTLAQAQMAAGLATSDSRASSDSRRARGREGREARGKRPDEGGKPLGDEVAARYEGVYRDPGETDPARSFFLARDPCGPQMMLGAMWGDAESIYLRVESQDVLAQPPEQVRFGEPLRIEVERDGDGRPLRLSHNAGWAASPLVREGDLPEEWQGQACTGR